MDRTGVAEDYARFSELAFLLVREPVVAEVIAVDAVLAAMKKTRAPDAPPAIRGAKRKLARQAMGYIRRRRLARLLPWTKDQPPPVTLAEGTRKVWDAVARLRPRQQVAVVMARIEGANLTDIADALDVAAPTAHRYMDQARTQLVRRLGDQVELPALLTRELRAVADAFTRQHRPDPALAQRVARAGRWRVWAVGIGLVTLTGAGLFGLLHG